MDRPSACPDCLRRSYLLARLAPCIEKVATGAPGSRSPELLALSSEDLAAAVAPKVAEQMLDRVAAIPERRLFADLTAARCWACCRHDPLYPSGLREAPDAAWALIGRGDPALLERLEPGEAVTIVGARRASSYGREVARHLGRELAAAGLAVVSGLAFGIDACAHRGALDAGLTVAVLGSGADVAYPAAHRSLWRQVCERGLVLSELPPGTGAWRWSFPARNRIMAALAGMTVVVEAAERSGSLITADLASDLGRDLGAVPGPVGSLCSAGPNNLLAGGACVIRDAQDVLDAMLGVGVRSVRRYGPPLERDLVEVLEAVERGEETGDAIAAALPSAPARVAAALARLEASGYLVCSAIGAYTRTPLSPPPGDEHGTSARVSMWVLRWHSGDRIRDMQDPGPEQSAAQRIYVRAKLIVDRRAAAREAQRRRIEADPTQGEASKADALEKLSEDARKHDEALTQIEEGVLGYGETVPADEHFERVVAVIEAEEAAGVDVFAQAGGELRDELALALARWDQVDAEMAALKRVEGDER